VDAISAKTIKETVRIKMVGCYACPIQCKKVVKLNAPWTVDPVYGGPEYETLAALGSDCGIDDLAAICKANELCEKYTLDTISTGAVIAFAMECFENGLITEKDTDGIQLNFGNAKAMVQMVEKIAKREGIGDLLAEGVLRAAEKLGEEAKPFAIHVKGQEVPMHDPRLKRGLGLGYAVSPTGAEHCNSIHDTQFSDEAWRDLKSLGILAPVSVEDFSSKKVRLFIYWVNWRILDDCWGLCNFLPWDYNQKVDIVRAITGWNSTAWELVKTAERVITLARIYNIREGFTQKDDWLPSRFFEPQTSGPLSRTTVDGEKLRSAIRTYYAMMGWDKETGIPLKEKLDELDIAWAANGLTNQK
jgi:aldehyde:ferredoxin oxidoreductase